MSSKFLVAVCGAVFMAEGAKLTFDERVEIIRGLMSEYATARTLVPRSKKTLEIHSSTGQFDKAAWEELAKSVGPAARVGDLIQITKVEIEDDRIVLEINGGAKGKRKWYENVQVGVGTRTTPINQGGYTPAPGGTTIALQFDKDVPAASAADLKKMLSQVMSFELRTATEQAIDTLPPEIKAAVTEHRAIEGMDQDQVIMALGKPRTKVRENKDGTDVEDWIYGLPPGKVTFVTFANGKVIRVKESYAGLGGETVPVLKPPV